jgi:hypothetical protein
MGAIAGDSRYGADGWHYGVRFHDGSVLHPWNGATQRDRAQAFIEEAYRRLEEHAAERGRAADWYIDRFELVRQRPGRPWEFVRREART